MAAGAAPVAAGRAAAVAAAEEDEAREGEREEREEGKHLKAASSTIDRRLSRSGGPGRDTTPSRAISPTKEVPKRLRRARYVAPTLRW